MVRRQAFLSSLILRLHLSISAGRFQRVPITMHSSRCFHPFRRLSSIWRLSSGLGKFMENQNVNTAVRQIKKQNSLSRLDLLCPAFFNIHLTVKYCVQLLITVLCRTGKLFWYRVHYNSHVRTHTKEHLHYCSKCSYSSITKSSLKRHQIQKHSGLLLTCSNPDCKYSTPDKYKLQAHMRTHKEQVTSLSRPVPSDRFLICGAVEFIH